jgi:DNA-binding NarL/FixJ family response regulator
MLLSAMRINSAADFGQPAPFRPPFLVDETGRRFAMNLQAAADDRSSRVSSGEPKVLIVDDSDMTLRRARSVLSATCVVVGSVTCPHAALEAAATLDPDVVVLDISMPGMNGFELAQRLAANGSTAKLVFLTVHEEEDLILAARNVGGTGYVLKTRLASDLELAVREAHAGRPFQSPLR